MMIDSGAEANVISLKDWQTIEREREGGNAILYDVDDSPRLKLRAFGAEENLTVLKTFKAWIGPAKGRQPRTVATFIVTKEGTTSLLGRRSAKQLNVLKVGLSINTIQEEEKEEVGEFPTIPGQPVKFDVDESVPPVRHCYVSIPAHFRDPANKRLEWMERKGIIERVRTSPRWLSGLSAVPKGKGDFRLVVNMRGPNRAIKRQFHMMPRVEEIRVRLNGARVFTKLDLTNAFHHVALDEESRELTTFMAPNGMYRFKRLVFGVNCAPEIFQRIMEEILVDIPKVIVYIDDILIFANDAEELRNTTEKVKAALKASNLTLNTEKCEFEKESLTFLGHTISENGINIDERKIRDIAKFRRPKSVSELKSFLFRAAFHRAYGSAVEGIYERKV